MNSVAEFRRLAMVLATAATVVPVCSAQVAPASHGIIQLSTSNPSGIPARNFNSTMSLNWSGYVLPSFVTQATYTSAQGTWTVPTAKFQPSLVQLEIQHVLGMAVPQFSSSWVGIGGYCETSNCRQRDTTLIQLGTSQEAVTATQSVYYAWYELLPAAPVVIPRLVAAGDAITASLTCTASCTTGTTQTWTLSMSDTNPNRSWTWSTNVSYESSLLSSEWIMEAPTSTSFGILPLPNFGTEVFNPANANGSGAPLASGDSITMVDPWGATATPSAPSGSLFSVCYSLGYLPATCSGPPPQ